jgi:hypothetical protein
MKASLDALNHNMAVPSGVRFTKTHLHIEKVTQETLSEASAWLQRVEGCRAWWWGDLLCSMFDFRLHMEHERADDMDAATASYHMNKYALEVAEAQGLEANTVKHWRLLASFYKPLCRHNDLTWSHHWEAYAGSDNDVAIAQDWLAKAHKHGWSKSELRAQILAAKQKQDIAEPMPTLQIADLGNCARWAKARLKNVDDLSPTDAALILREMEPILKLATVLQNRVEKVA